VRCKSIGSMKVVFAFGSDFSSLSMCVALCGTLVFYRHAINARFHRYRHSIEVAAESLYMKQWRREGILLASVD
jgi:hypothetical protein